jgi:hypothetical protein
VTTYAENIGVMAATKHLLHGRVLRGGVLAVLLGFSPKFGALIQAIPAAGDGRRVHRGVRPDRRGGAKIWVDNKVDFSDTKNLIVAPSP